jgi:hypothetical protein
VRGVKEEVLTMFFTQVVIPVIIIAAVCFWAGREWEKERREAELKKPTIKTIRKRYRRLKSHVKG